MHTFQLFLCRFPDKCPAESCAHFNNCGKTGKHYILQNAGEACGLEANIANSWHCESWDSSKGQVKVARLWWPEEWTLLYMECKVVSARLLSELLQCIGYPGDWWPVWMLFFPLGLIEMFPCLWPRWTDRLRIRESIRRGHRLDNLKCQGFFPSELHYQRPGQEGKSNRKARGLERGRDADSSSGEFLKSDCKELLSSRFRSHWQTSKKWSMPFGAAATITTATTIAPERSHLTPHDACKVFSDSALLLCSSLTWAVLTPFYMDEDKEKGFKSQGGFSSAILTGRL